MVWAKVLLAGGVLILAASFGFGTQPRSTTAGDQTYACGAAISASWLVPGTADRAAVQGPAASDQLRKAAACDPVIHQSRVVMFSALALGALMALVGWTELGERRRTPESGQLLAH